MLPLRSSSMVDDTTSWGASVRRHTIWLALLAACHGGVTSDEDTDLVDTDPADTDTVDTDVADTADTDDADTDTQDTDAVPFTPDAACEYLDLDRYVVFCGGVQSSLLGWVSPVGGVGCPPFFSVDGDAWLDASDALSQGGCDDTCVYRNHQSVMLVYCEVRGEYITYQPDGPGQVGDGATCDPLMEVHTVAGDAWVPDLATYQAQFPCPT